MIFDLSLSTNGSIVDDSRIALLLCRFHRPCAQNIKKKDNIEQRVHSFFREFVISERPEQHRDRDLLSRS